MSPTIRVCRHHKMGRISIRELPTHGNNPGPLVQWCPYCGALKTDNGPWWHPERALKPKSRRRRP